MNHFGLITHDLDGTIEFYQHVQLEFAYTVRSVPGDSYLEPVRTDPSQRSRAASAARGSA